MALFAVGVTVAWRLLGYDIDLLVLDPRWWHGEPWRLVTSAFPHVDALHLLFNLYWLWTFGSLVEHRYGALRTIAIYMLFSVGSGLGEYSFLEGGVGLSGVGYGLFGFLWVMSRKDARFYDIVDRHTTILFVGWFFFCIATTAVGVMHVANIAHGMGAVLGVMLGHAVAGARRRRQGAVAALVATMALLGLLGSVARPYVNFSPRGLFDEGYQALLAGDNKKAVAVFRRAVEADARQYESWYDLGLALRRLDKYQEAAEAYEHAYALRPYDPDAKAALLSIKLLLVSRAENSGRHPEAARLCREVLAIDGSDPAVWRRLGTAYIALSKTEHAKQAFATARSLEAGNKTAQ